MVSDWIKYEKFTTLFELCNQEVLLLEAVVIFFLQRLLAKKKIKFDVFKILSCSSSNFFAKKLLFNNFLLRAFNTELIFGKKFFNKIK